MFMTMMRMPSHTLDDDALDAHLKMYFDQQVALFFARCSSISLVAASFTAWKHDLGYRPLLKQQGISATGLFRLALPFSSYVRMRIIQQSSQQSGVFTKENLHVDTNIER